MRSGEAGNQRTYWYSEAGKLAVADLLETDEEYVRGDFHGLEANEDAGPAVAEHHLSALTGGNPSS